MNIIFISAILGIIGFYLYWYFILSNKGEEKNPLTEIQWASREAIIGGI
jgi:uncharacterized membrane protein SpoIIM required for sporulation